MEKFMMNRFRFPFSQKPRLVLACLIVTTIISASFCLYYGMIHQEAWEQQIRYFQKNHEKNVATLNSVEQKINSYYHQLMSNADVVGIITKSDYGKDEYYTLSRIQADFLNIVSSDPVIDSIGLYSRNSGKVLSTHYMFSNLDYYPDHAIINRFYSQKISQKWFPSRDKRDGDGGSPRILSFVAGVPFNSLNGVIVFNINQKVLFSKLGLKPTGIIILDRQNKRICSQDGYINAVYQRNRDRLADIAREGREVVRVKDRNRNYYLFTTILNRSGWRVVSVVAESGIQAGIKSNLAGLYSILTVLILAIMGLAKLFQMNYAQSLRVYRDKLETNIEGLIDNTISGMLTGEYTQEEIIAKTAEFGIDLSGDYYLTVVFQMNNYYRFLLETKDYLPRVRVCKAIRNRIEQRFGAYKNAITSMELGKIVVLLALNLDRDESEITEDIAQRVREIQQQVECEFQFTLKAAVSEVLQGSESIRICYAQALQSLNYIHSSKGNSLIFFREVESRTTPALNFPVMEIVCLKEYLKNGNRAKLEQSIESICGKLLAEPYYSGDWVNAIFSNILYEVNTVWLEWGFSGKDIFGGEDLFVKLYSYESVEEKKAYLVNACVALMAYRADKEGNTQKLAVQRVIAYIEKNYDKTISLEIVAEEVGMNPSYLSTFFKKEVGIHFAEYIMTLRLKKALLLLGDGRLTVKQIAQECGYDTVHSFIRNFKKYYQVTPSEFRNQHSS